MKKRPESAIQFDAIFAEHNDPTKRAEKRIKENRGKCSENKKKDLGI